MTLIINPTVPDDGKYLSLYRGLIEAPVLHSYPPPVMPDTVSMQGILQKVSESSGFPVSDLKRRSAGYTDPEQRRRAAARDEAMWLMWNVPGDGYTGRRYSLTQIARLMGLADHTAALAAARRHAKRLSEAPGVRRAA